MNLPPSALLAGLCLAMVSCETPGTDPATSFTAVKGGEQAAAARPKAYAISSGADADDLVRAAVRHHPSLQATRSQITALEQSAIQARALPDPSASVGAGQLAETAAGEVQATFGVQQKIPYPGKRRTEALRILRQADALQAQLHTQELALAQQVRNAYWHYYSANRTVAIVSEGKDPLTTLRDSVEARIATNKAAQQDLLRIENEITRLDQRLATARGRQAAARASLNALLYRPGHAALPAPRAGGFPEHGSAASLLARASNRHPEVAAAQSRIAAAENGLSLAQLKRKPDFTAGVTYSPVSDEGLAPSANGRDQFMGMLGVTLPLWREKNEAAEGEAAAKLSAERSSLASTRSSLQQRIESAHASYRAERTNLALYRDRLLPDAQQSFDLSLTGYEAETVTFIDVIDAWRQLLNYRLEYEENRARAGKADAALRVAAGLP